jgi:2-dehydropantoate 2-reductase
MKLAIVGAGAMGSAFGGRLAESGHQVLLVDTRADHVAAINRDGLCLDGVFGRRTIRLPAVTAPDPSYGADVAIVWTDSNNTRAGAETAARCLSPAGFAITLQNGIGNVEVLVEVIGKRRVAAGSSMCSAASSGPGTASLTHMGTTSLGEIDGGGSPRIEALAQALRGADFDVKVQPDVMATVWSKFALNCAINALCAATGLRLGELARLEATDRLQDYVIAEILAVSAARGSMIDGGAFRSTVKSHCWSKYSRPSMLQHIHAGKPTEIDALNMRLVAEGRRVGVATPYNEALALLLKGVEHKAGPARGRTDADYAQLEAKAAGEPRLAQP